MLSFLKNHPFAVEAFFKSSIVLTFAVPKEQLQHMIPECLELDTFQDNWAFIAVAMVETEGLRPKGFPKILGNDFFLTGYRIFVRYTNTSGKRLRGLYILKSETDKRRMEFLGNIFTKYSYTTTDILRTVYDDRIAIQSVASNFTITIGNTADAIPLPCGSPFADWKEARRFAGPLPFTFSYDPDTKKVLLIEGVRQNWIPKPLAILDYNLPFLSSLHLDTAILANAFIINDIPYFWKKGKTEQWQ